MPTATITSKGQITVPKEIRDALKVGAGDRLDFRWAPDGSLRVDARKRDLRELAGRLHRPGRKALSIREMDQAIARRLTADR